MVVVPQVVGAKCEEEKLGMVKLVGLMRALIAGFPSAVNDDSLQSTLREKIVLAINVDLPLLRHLS